MEQKIIQIGNSVGVIIPQTLQQDMPLKPGEKVFVERDPVNDSYIVSKKKTSQRSSITPEFVTWLEKFNKKYSHVLAELAKK